MWAIPLAGPDVLIRTILHILYASWYSQKDILRCSTSILFEKFLFSVCITTTSPIKEVLCVCFKCKGVLERPQLVTNVSEHMKVDMISHCPRICAPVSTYKMAWVDGTTTSTACTVVCEDYIMSLQNVCEAVKLHNFGGVQCFRMNGYDMCSLYKNYIQILAREENDRWLLSIKWSSKLKSSPNGASARLVSTGICLRAWK